MNTTERQLENELAFLIHEHADWLDGVAFLAVAKRVALAYFPDSDFKADDLLDAAMRAEMLARPLGIDAGRSVPA